MPRQRLRADAAAPAGADDCDANLSHGFPLSSRRITYYVLSTESGSCARFVQEIWAQRFLPVRDGGDLFLAEQDLRMVRQIGLEIAREAGIHHHARKRLAEGLGRHLVALGGIEGVDDIGDLLRLLLEVARDI